MDIKLKPCPLCGKECAEISNAADLEDCKYFDDCKECPQFNPVTENHDCHCYIVVCSIYKGGCGCSTGYSFNRDHVVKMWNRRAEQAVKVMEGV